jgi:hypothetical protein
MAQDNLLQAYTIGDIVRITESFGPNPAGSLGIVYETYSDQDTQAPDLVSVLLTNGHDIGSFNGEEQTESLQHVGHVTLSYAYSSPGQLMTDYRRGYFDQAFTEARSLAENPTTVDAEHQ